MGGSANGTRATSGRPRVLVYGLEKLRLTAPTEEQDSSTHTLVFEPFSTSVRFQQFSGVIVFQGLFERFRKRTDDIMGESWLEVECDDEMLDQREKEVAAIREAGGFVCVPLHQRFIDGDRYRRFDRTDLAKRLLNRRQLTRRDLGGERFTQVRSTENEFNRFLGLFGAASTYFEYRDDELDVRPLAKLGNSVVGFQLERSLLFVPVLLPSDQPERLLEFFELLVPACLDRFSRSASEAPAWAKDYSFPQEKDQRARLKDLLKEEAGVRCVLEQAERWKLTLVHDGQALVGDVQLVLSEGLGLQVRLRDELREDLQVLDEGGCPALLVEVKGTSAGVKREHVNQADSHRERAGATGDFPSVLIANTAIKVASSLSAKDVEVAPEQATHARKQGVLILRTLDLLNLVSLRQSKGMSTRDVLELLRSSSGWLRVTSEGWDVLPPHP